MQTDKKLPSYVAPPLAEVACGFAFTLLPNFKIPHFGLFWSYIRNEYPKIEHAAPLAADEGIPVDEATGLPLPRVWFIDKSDTRLVQLQPNRVYVNWRSRPHDTKYPRYEQIMGSLRGAIKALGTLAEDAGLGSIVPQAGELTYVNHFSPGQDVGAFMESTFKDFCWQRDGRRFLPLPHEVSWRSNFTMPGEGGVLRVRLYPARRQENNEALYVLELSAKSARQYKNIDEVLPWFDLAHEWIVKGFTDLTTEKAQKDVWKRER